MILYANLRRHPWHLLVVYSSNPAVDLRLTRSWCPLARLLIRFSQYHVSCMPVDDVLVRIFTTTSSGAHSSNRTLLPT